MEQIYKRNNAKNFIFLSLFFFVIYLCFLYLGIDLPLDCLGAESNASLKGQ